MKWKSGLDVAANVAILGVGILIGVIGVKKFLLSNTHGVVDIPRKGSRMELASVNWGRADRTLVLALSTKCHFCDDSADFYRRLAPAAAAAEFLLSRSSRNLSTKRACTGPARVCH